MNFHHQITAPSGHSSDDEDIVARDSIDHHHIRYEDGNPTGVVEDVSPDSVYAPSTSAASDLAVQRNDVSSQLKLTFRGQVYVFDAVTPDKVQAVLVLLGGCGLASDPHGLEVTSQNQRGAVLDYPLRCTQPQRAASLNSFRQKRKKRCFYKKVRYSVRQQVALRMQRNKGQFTSSKKSDGTNGWGGDQDSGHDSQQEISCTHCGISSKSTPMMRRGPSGPKSLCNACGLYWANRGTLRDLSKKTHELCPTPMTQGEAEANDYSGNVMHTDLDRFLDEGMKIPDEAFQDSQDPYPTEHPEANPESKKRKSREEKLYEMIENMEKENAHMVAELIRKKKMYPDDTDDSSDDSTDEEDRRILDKLTGQT